MIRPAIIVPRMSMSQCQHENPTMADRFFLIDLKYIDRSGWPRLIDDDTESRLRMARERVILSVVNAEQSKDNHTEDEEEEDYEEDEEDEKDDDEGRGRAVERYCQSSNKDTIDIEEDGDNDSCYDD